MTKVLYPGSFDPITKGHMNIVEQALELFDEVVIAVLPNSSKSAMFTIEERMNLVKEIYKNNNKVTVVTGQSASVDIAKENGCKAIIRGLRGLSDYDYEVQIAQTNKEISSGTINTICLFADKEYQFLSSSIVKEVFRIHKDISKYVTPEVIQKMQEKNM
ncbi:MAG: pantetheine-phosphate adenylyltransferase [Bacilli bacterium]|nr:pantetheine-phosphate adenylyltransferase [Bacilli bacterium]